MGARGIDLLQTIAEISNSPNGAVQAASKFMYWLGRERVNEEDLNHCLGRAKDLAHPNTAGWIFCSRVIEGIETMPHSVLKPFKSITSGSLGRYLVLDPGLSWITSTITSLYQYHDEKFIAYAVTALIVQMHAQREGKQTAICSTFWSNPTCMRMIPVVKKITSSIWLNIVNSGNASMPLPDELRNICPIGHHLDSEDLVEALARLKNPCRGSCVIITSRYMLGNISLWLLYHFSGLFRVVVGGETVYESRQGHEKQEIELRINMRCKADGKCVDGGDKSRQFEMVENIAGDWTQFFEGSSKSSSSLGSTSRARKPLYSFNDWQAVSPQYSHTMHSRIRKVALDLARWFCSLRIDPFPQAASGIVYKVNLTRSGAGDKHHILMNDLFRRSPSILQAAWAPDLPTGWTPEEAVEIWSPEGFAEARTSPRQVPNLSDNTDSARATRQSLVWRCYPGLNDLIGKAQSECSCVSCARGRNDTHLQPGCLKFYSYASVLSLLAHSIADAFGADNASGSVETSLQADNSDVHSVERILLDVAKNSRVVWQTWFEVASCVYLGRRYSNAEARRYENGLLPADNSMTIAIQYGGLAVVAPWIDLSMEVKHLGSFGFVTVQGRLCVSTARQSGSDSDHQFLNTEFAVIKTRPTETIEVDDQPNDLDAKSSDLQLGIDDHHVEVDAILFPSDDEVYFLLTRVRAGRFSRLINPCVPAIMQAKHLHDMYSEVCKHESGHTPRETESDLYKSTSVYSFDRLLGKWPCIALSRLHMSQVLDTHLKYNIALALAEGGIVAVNKSGCWTCSAGKLLGIKSRHVRMSSGLFLIHINDMLREGNDKYHSMDLVSN